MNHFCKKTSQALLLACSLALGACGGGEGGDGLESDGLACEQHQYACSWSGVAQTTIERSVGLGEQAAAKLKAGASTTEVAAWLEQNEVLAEIQFDDGLMRFRLVGGRPIWIAKSSRMEPAPGPTISRGTAPAQRLGAASAGAGIVRPDVEQKRALVLDPYRYLAGPANGSVFSGGAEVAAKLYGTRGYAGRVTLLQNATEDEDHVTIDTFGTFGQYDVVYVQTLGGRLCFDLKTNLAFPCKAFVKAQLFHGTPLDLVNSTAKGVELLILDDTHKSLILADDYFRSQYPDGLQNTLVFRSSRRTTPRVPTC